MADYWWDYYPDFKKPVVERSSGSEVRPIYSPTMTHPIQWWKVAIGMVIFVGLNLGVITIEILDIPWREVFTWLGFTILWGILGLMLSSAMH